MKRVPHDCGACVFWESPDALERRCGARCDREAAAEWFSQVLSEWGECGRVVVEDDEPLGFIKYAPSRYFPQVATFPSAPEDPDVPFIACLHVSPDARGRGLGRLLLQAALRDLASRGNRKVQGIAYAPPMADPGEIPMVGVAFLLRHGFTVAGPHPTYPLLELELRSLALITENLESVLESLRLPLRAPRQAPVPWT
jgi:GNAT superfamily N-acetyltransferase